MTILTRDQLTQYAQNAGFNGNGLNTIVAIAFAESSGNTEAVNSQDPYGGSFGVLQINGSHIVPYGSLQMSCAYDPQCSFNYAYQLSSNGTNFNPWGSYTDGRYLQYLQGTGTPSSSSSGSTIPTTTTIGSSGNPISGLTTAVQDIGSVSSLILQWGTNPIRVLKMIFGIILIAIPIILLVAPETVDKVAPAVAEVAA